MISTGNIRDASRAGQPAAVREDDVTRLLHERRTEASARQPDALTFAQQVRRTIWPDEDLDMVVLADGREDIANPDQARRVISSPRGRDTLRTLNSDAVALFGRAAVETAAIPRDTWRTHCRWCYADASARALGGLRPADSPAYVALLGAQPCPRDRERWAAEDRERRLARGRAQADRLDAALEAEQSRVRQEFRAAEDALGTASRRRTEAIRRLASVDPATALTAAARSTRGAVMACGCTRTRYCDGHAAVFGTHDRTQAYR
ncbi:hypothetical protein ACIRPU_02100 [Streptomyces sp. NPDC102259]|uniref:hypothetical protein n=1 Tax=Streptomyces sp. NPDC102259 TaxID=3366148 RepID=UPI003804AF7E